MGFIPHHALDIEGLGTCNGVYIAGKVGELFIEYKMTQTYLTVLELFKSPCQLLSVLLGCLYDFIAFESGWLQSLLL